mmetsp:Transcript_10886/g.18887  ORF Transcript_10886/g.18887 Transcript_10886/m.18887 type:complete len:106 (-) Transcript_10886:477-794(-)|eukprot:CAMPEP_0119115124 /NCGR_PEP_ID=MMETSP1180-20130426/49876_1 /TAXON_ID=3052 ORGANISM="Chlamydomonas cf sp, Strain CCMP681" /NCGR_SAMPLE_ID=MMETSP1180 /ASSEMBLY_ACC=CAM_ASM_000741 /LENGTH=105 /DNA_ID=CAMNT_0007103961 /DNA_START=324 /DNA_END=641 /DNA_ORIENTATION=+
MTRYNPGQVDNDPTCKPQALQASLYTAYGADMGRRALSSPPQVEAAVHKPPHTSSFNSVIGIALMFKTLAKTEKALIKVKHMPAMKAKKPACHTQLFFQDSPCFC